MENQKEAILSKTFELFRKYGIKSVSMDDLARELGMSKKTLYQFIGDKNQLVEDVLNRMRTLVHESLLVFQNKDYNAIKQFFVMEQNMELLKISYQPSFAYDLHKYYPSLMKNKNEEKEAMLTTAFISNLKQGKEEGLYYDDLNEDIICRLLVHINLKIFSVESEFFSEQEMADKANIDEVFKYHFRGICTVKGMKELEKLVDQSTNCHLFK